MKTASVTRRLARPLAVGTAGLLLAIMALVGTPSAADTGPLSVRSVDATGGSLVVDVAAPGATKAPTVTLDVDGKTVKPTSVSSFKDAGVANSVMVVLDNSATIGNGPVQIAKQAILASLDPETGPASQIGVVSIGGGVQRLVGPASSQAQLRSGLDGIAPRGKAALWDGVLQAADSFGDVDGSSRDIVIVSGAADGGSSASFTEALREVKNSGAAVHVVALQGGTPDMVALQSLVAQAGGTIQVGNSDGLRNMFTKVSAQLSAQWRITLPAVARSTGELVPLTVNWGDQSFTVSYEPGAVSIGTDNLKPIDTNDGILDKILDTTVTKYLIVVLGCMAAGMVVYSLGSLVTRQKDRLDFALRHYDGYSVDELATVQDDEGSFAKGDFLKKAVELTGDLAQRQGILTKVEALLERADLPLRPAEALFFYVAIVAVAAIGAALLSGDLLVLLVVVLLAAVAPKYFVSFRAKRRRKQFLGALPDMLTLLAGTLRAGYSISQGFESVSNEVDGPMGRELRRIMAEARLGRPLEEALDAAAERVQSDDFGWAVMAIRIQREVGGNLAELLLTVADTMTQRERLRRDVAALTAEGRMSAIVLGCLPPGLAGVMFVMNHEYIAKLFTDSMGMAMLIGSIVMMLVGFAWMKKIITIEI